MINQNFVSSSKEKEKEKKKGNVEGERETELTLSVLTRARRGEGYRAYAVALATETAAPLVSGHGTKRKGGGRRCEKDGAFYTQALFMRTGRRPRIRV